MALLTSISAANEVLVSYSPPFAEKSTSGEIAKERFRTQKTIEYRGLDQATAIAAADAVDGDLDGTILSDGAQTSPTLHVDGFDNATGTVWPGTAVHIDGDDHTYHVSATATIASNEVDLVLSENFLEAGTILVDGGSQTGTELAIDGFTNAVGKVRMGTLLEIAGDATDYTVTEQANIADNEATVTITPTLAASPADGAAVTLTHPAVDGTPITLTASGVSGRVNRTGDSGAYTLTIEVDYFPFGNSWENA